MAKKYQIDNKYYPHDGQKKFHLSTARHKILCCGRRWGKTLAVAQEIFYETLISKDLRKANGGKPILIWIVANTYSIAGHVEEELIPLLRPIIDDKKSNKKEHKYVLITGDVIEIKSADHPDNLLGAGVHLMALDEAAIMKAEIWYQILQPMLLSTQGRSIIISTPRGKNWFYDLFMLGQDKSETNYESWSFSTYTNPHIPPKEIDDMKKNMPETIFRQEIMAEFLDDSLSYFRNINNCLVKETEKPAIIQKCFECEYCSQNNIILNDYDPRYKEFNVGLNSQKCFLCGYVNSFSVTKQEEIYYIGVDLAKTTDFTVITVVKCNPNGKIRLVEMDRFNNIQWTIQKERIVNTYRKYGGIVMLDSTGLGDPILEDLQLAGIPADGLKFTNTSKGNILNKLSILFERELIEIPEYDILLKELREFEVKQTEGGRWVYSAPAGRHDDCVISLALACWKTPPVLISERGNDANRLFE